MIEGVHGIVRRLVSSPQEVAVVEWRRGSATFRFRVPGDDMWISVKDDLLIREYEWMGVDLTDTSGLVVDAGAHVGTFAAMATLFADRVVAFEPNPDNLELLRANIDDNGLDSIEVRAQALWSDTEGRNISGRSSWTSVVDDDTAGDDTERVDVATTTLTDLLNEIGQVDLLKIDIEGAEFAVFEHTSDEMLRRIRRIAGEIHPVHGDADAIVKQLEGAGFDVTLKKGPFHEPWSALGAIRSNHRSIRGHYRLKIVVPLLYVTAAVIERIRPGFRDRIGWIPLFLLYAERRDVPADNAPRPRTAT
ncbi:MAG: FkbM family methyltransferase [Acidimicrobiales bacterium]